MELVLDVVTALPEAGAERVGEAPKEDAGVVGRELVRVFDLDDILREVGFNAVQLFVQVLEQLLLKALEVQAQTFLHSCNGLMQLAEFFCDLDFAQVGASPAGVGLGDGVSLVFVENLKIALDRLYLFEHLGSYLIDIVSGLADEVVFAEGEVL